MLGLIKRLFCRHELVFHTSHYIQEGWYTPIIEIYRCRKCGKEIKVLYDWGLGKSYMPHLRYKRHSDIKHLIVDKGHFEREEEEEAHLYVVAIICNIPKRQGQESS
jgi:hypothetical protein